MRPTTTLRVLLLVVAASAGCTSPESLRVRGGGAGADRGNRPRIVKMHAGSDPFWKTPDHIGVAHVPLGPGRQARAISTP